MSIQAQILNLLQDLQEEKGFTYDNTGSLESGFYLSHIQGGTTAGYGELGTNPKNHNHVDIHAEIHKRGIQSHDTFGFCKVLTDVVRRRIEFLLFVFFPGEAFYHSHAADIFFNRFV